MAIVRITSHVTEEINREIAVKFYPRLGKLQTSVLKAVDRPALAMRVLDCYNRQTGVHPIMDQLPDEYFTTIHDITLGKINGFQVPLGRTVRFSAPTRVPVFTAYISVLGPRRTLSLEDPSLQYYVDAVKPIWEEYSKLVDQQNRLQEHVAKLLSNCGTLQQALLAWPSVAKFIPQLIQDRLDEKAVRRTPADRAPRISAIDAIYLAAVAGSVSEE